ncbi:MAG: DNA repair protein RadC [Nitrospirae bacterium]|uniref:RadC family protein n=1 Tax=Candidatus Magnetobacterium casense TaxID=1455061 RepID=UPI000590DD66|nr:DNA repair protein RadC [Candidatus Magnetobacterium casensis]MBF0339130.1 DNA repair protein RadC [Nitrospirota bacterium]
MTKANGSKPHYLGHRSRLRDRYVRGGIDSLNDYEAVELLLTFVHSRRDVKPQAKDLLGRFDGIRGLLDAGMDDLIGVGGVGRQTAILIKLARDFVELYMRETLLERQVVRCPDDIIDYLRISVGSLKDERFMTLFLNARNEIVAFEVVSEGTVNSTVVYPRKIFENALRHKATAMILVHNHPSGSLKVSEDDIKLTKNLKRTADTLGIIIHDHLIVTNDDYVSLSQKGLI